MEELARQRSLKLAELDAAGWDTLWNEVKRAKNPPEPAWNSVQ